MEVLPLFKTHFSIGKSILTLDDPDISNNSSGSDSVFTIAKEYGLKKIILVEDSLIGFFRAYKKCESLDIQLIFGLRVSMRNSDLEEDASSQHKIIIFSKNGDGVKLLNKIFSRANTEHKGFLTYSSLKEIWDKDCLLMAVPFYDSFLHVNNFSFANAVPDFSFVDPIFFIEENNLPFFNLLKNKVIKFAEFRGFNLKNQIQLVKTILYKERKDVSALMSYKIICNRTFGKERTLQRPELSYFSSDEFCFESWREKYAKV